MIDNKFILDACCSARQFWNNKHHPNCLYMDIRKEKIELSNGEVLDIIPDIQGDFTNLPQEVKEHKFKLIVWDVPHFRARKLTGDMLKKYGGLNPETWQSDLKKGFSELWSVLEDYGVLLFKFSDYHIKFNDVMKLFPEQPLFYNKTSSKGDTSSKWFCFMRIPIKLNSGGNSSHD